MRKMKNICKNSTKTCAKIVHVHEKEKSIDKYVTLQQNRINETNEKNKRRGESDMYKGEDLWKKPEIQVVKNTF